MSTNTRTSTKLQRSVRDMLVYQARALKGMMLAHNRGLTALNMARVPRDLEWCWDTFEAYENSLGPFKDEVQKTMDEVEEVFQNFDFGKVRNNEDETARAIRHYQNETEETE